MKNAIMLVIVLLSGCAGKMVKSGASKQDYYHDLTECKVATRQISGFSAASNFGDTIQRNRVMEECMLGQGWHRE